MKFLFLLPPDEGSRCAKIIMERPFYIRQAHYTLLQNLFGSVNTIILWCLKVNRNESIDT